MTHKFLKYIENEQPPEQCYGLMGIAVISKFDGQQIDNYIIKQNKDANGFFVSAMAQKMNDCWHKASIIDSNYADKEINDMIRKHVNEYYQSKTKVTPSQGFDEEAPF